MSAYKHSNRRALHTLHNGWTGTENSRFQTFAVFWMLYAFFWLIPRRLNFICRRYGTLYLFHLHRQVSMERFRTYPPMKMEQSVPKRRHMKFRLRGSSQKKAYNRNREVVPSTLQETALPQKRRRYPHGRQLLVLMSSVEFLFYFTCNGLNVWCAALFVSTLLSSLFIFRHCCQNFK